MCSTITVLLLPGTASLFCATKITVLKVTYINSNTSTYPRHYRQNSYLNQVTVVPLYNVATLPNYLYIPIYLLYTLYALLRQERLPYPIPQILLDCKKRNFEWSKRQHFVTHPPFRLDYGNWKYIMYKLFDSCLGQLLQLGLQCEQLLPRLLQLLLLPADVYPELLHPLLILGEVLAKLVIFSEQLS